MLNGESKVINIFLRAPAKVTAGDYYFKFILKDKEQNYIEKFKLNVKKINGLKFDLLEKPEYIKKEFNLQLLVENKGNTKRKLNLRGNNISIKNDKLILKAFEKKQVILQCKLNSISKKPYINIFAESRNGKKINIYNKKVALLNYNKRSKKLKSILKLNYYDVNKNNDKSWSLKTYFNQQTYLSLQDNSFKFQYKNKNKLWQIGSRYFNSFIQLGNQSSELSKLKLAYQDRINNFKRIIYTDFNNEFGIGNYYKNNYKYYYLELKANNHHLDYYFKGRVKRNNISYLIKNYSKAENTLYNIEVKKSLHNSNIFKIGYYLKGRENYQRKYFRYIDDKIKNKITYGYSLKTTDDYERKNLLYINEYNRHSGEIIKLDYGVKNNYYKRDKKYLKLMFKKDSYRVNIRFNDFLEGDNIKFKLSKLIKSNKLNSSVIVDNYDGLRLGLQNKYNYKIGIQKKLRLEGYYSYNFKRNKFYSNISFGLSIPLKYEYSNNKKDLIPVRAEVKANIKDLSGIVFDVNGKKILTDKKGKLSTKILKDKSIRIQVADLGDFEADYYLQPPRETLIDNYKGEKIIFKLVKYTNFKVEFKKLETAIDKYIDSENDELLYISLYNNENEYIKKYKGGQEINFNKIKPGFYKLTITNIYSPFKYNNKERKVKLKSTNSKIVVKKQYKKSKKNKKENKVKRLEVKN